MKKKTTKERCCENCKMCIITFKDILPVEDNSHGECIAFDGIVLVALNHVCFNHKFRNKGKK